MTEAGGGRKSTPYTKSRDAVLAGAIVGGGLTSPWGVASSWMADVLVMAPLFFAIGFAAFGAGLVVAIPLWVWLNRRGVRNWVAAMTLGAVISGAVMFLFTQTVWSSLLIAATGACVAATAWIVAYAGDARQFSKAQKRGVIGPRTQFFFVMAVVIAALYAGLAGSPLRFLGPAAATVYVVASTDNPEVFVSDFTETAEAFGLEVSVGSLTDPRTGKTDYFLNANNGPFMLSVANALIAPGPNSGCADLGFAYRDPGQFHLMLVTAPGVRPAQSHEFLAEFSAALESRGNRVSEHQMSCSPWVRADGPTAHKVNSP